MRKTKVILIGCGNMAKQHAARFEAVWDRIEISAAVDIERERAQAFADLMPNHPPVFTDYHEALPPWWCCRIICIRNAGSTVSMRDSMC